MKSGKNANIIIFRNSGRYGKDQEKNYTNASLFFDEEDDERSEHFLNLAEEALRKSLSLKNSFEGYIYLTEILIGKNEQID